MFSSESGSNRSQVNFGIAFEQRIQQLLGIQFVDVVTDAGGINDAGDVFGAAVQTAMKLSFRAVSLSSVSVFRVHRVLLLNPQACLTKSLTADLGIF